MELALRLELSRARTGDELVRLQLVATLKLLLCNLQGETQSQREGEGKSRFSCLAFNFALPIVARDNPTTRDNNKRGSSAKTPIKIFFFFSTLFTLCRFLPFVSTLLSVFVLCLSFRAFICVCFLSFTLILATTKLLLLLENNFISSANKIVYDIRLPSTIVPRPVYVYVVVAVAAHLAALNASTIWRLHRIKSQIVRFVVAGVTVVRCVATRQHFPHLFTRHNVVVVVDVVFGCIKLNYTLIRFLWLAG